MKSQAILEVNCHLVRANLEAMRKGRHAMRLWGVVKANAYGLGAVPVARAIHDLVEGFCVATVSEAMLLREAIPDKPILLFGYVAPEDVAEMIRRQIEPALSTVEDAMRWNAAAKKLGVRHPVHIAVDTGHRRVGFIAEQDAAARDIAVVAKLPFLTIEGMFSHLATADEAPFPNAFAEEQLSRFRTLAQKLEAAGVTIPLRHIANDAGLLFLPEADLFEGARLGICLYGAYPSAECEAATTVSLQTPYRWTAPISRVKWMEAGETVGYGRTWRSRRKTKVATVQLGYADGYVRLLSGRTALSVKGTLCRVIGRICMDQLMVDVTDAPPVEVGDRVLVMGAADWNQADSKALHAETEAAFQALFSDTQAGVFPAPRVPRGIAVDCLADRAETISYEILSGIASRVPRFYES